jgi:protein ATS1
MLVVSNAKGEQRVIGWGAGRRGEFDLATLGGTSPSQSGSSSKGKGKAAARPTTYPPTELTLPLKTDEKIVDVSLGASHTLALTSHHRVLAWGSDQKGQIRDTDELNNIVQIAAPWGGSYVLTNDGKVQSQGSNIYSQLLHEEEGRGEVNLPQGWTVEKIVAGTEHLLALLGDGTEQALWVGGWNEHGNLALGDQKDRGRLERVTLPPGRIKAMWGGCASTWVLIE